MRRREPPPPAHDTFEIAFTRLAALAFKVAYRLLGDRAEAEDIAQETLAKAYVRWTTVAGYAEPWCVRVATNLAIDRSRRLQRSLPSGSAPVEEAERAIERLTLARDLAALPRRQRDVLTMRYLADMSEAAVATALGCSKGSVKTHASRGLASLRLVFSTPMLEGTE